jgi:hypothetical protein
MLYYKYTKTLEEKVKIKNNYVKITDEEGLKELTRYQNNTYYQSKPDFVIFNLANVAYLGDDGRHNSVHISKGECHVTIDLTKEAFKKLEELIFEEK